MCVECGGDVVRLLGRHSALGKAHAQSELHVLHGAQDRRRRVIRRRAAHFVHAGERGLQCRRIGLQPGTSRIRNGVQLAPTLRGGHGDVAEVLEHGERRVNHAGARHVGAAQAVLDGLDYLVAVARPFGDERENNEAKLAVIEHAGPAAAVPMFVPVTMAAVPFVPGEIVVSMAVGVLVFGVKHTML
jgi:hypothetical protein